MSDYEIFVAVTVVRAGIVRIGGNADIFVFVHVDIADIGLVVIIIGIIGAAVTAALRCFFAFIIHVKYLSQTWNLC